MTITSTARPGFRAHEDSVKRADAEIVEGLRSVLGARLVAYLGNVGSTRAVREWAEGIHTPSAAVMQRLRTAYYVAGLLGEREGNATIQAWFMGMNPQLDDRSPAWLLREQPLDDVGRDVLSAARAFAAIG